MSEIKTVVLAQELKRLSTRRTRVARFLAEEIEKELIRRAEHGLRSVGLSTVVWIGV